MKQTEVTEKIIGGNNFYIKPFPAFVAANISGDLAALITPMIGGLAPLLAEKKVDNIMDADAEDVLPAISSAFSGLSGDKFERLMKKLLIDHKNISVEAEATGGNVKIMDYDTANEVFCGDVQDMFILCFEVIRINFGGFFKKLGAQFGSLQEVVQKVTPRSTSTEN